jgi:peptidyl-prolyl cis-trans isomerase B (cyclophilin B)
VTSLRRLSLLVLVVALLGLAAACGSDSGSTPKAAAKAQCSYPDDSVGNVKKVPKPPSNPPKDLPDQVTIATDAGDINVSLDTEQAPCTVNAFVWLAKQGFYDDTHCHRLTTEGLFVLQCGDPGATGKQGDPKAGQGGPGFTIADELVDKDPRLQPCTGQTDQSGREVCTYTTGTLALANRGPDTGGSQFFLVFKDSLLPASYNVFGKMSAAGVKVVQNIAKAGAYPPDASTGNTPPKQGVTISSIK